MTREEIAQRMEENGIPFSPELPEKMETYLALLAEWNQKMDLTAEATPEEWLERHFLDSLTVLKTDLLAGTRTLIDVGTGAGFPGLVLAMAMPKTRVTLLDAQRKRLDFLETVIQNTGTENAETIHARAEDGARNPALREGFDAAAARALAPRNVLCEYLMPFVRVGGRILCWKGPALAEEMENGRKAAFLLGGRVGEAVSCPILGRDWDHRILPVDKIRKTPSLYPRRAGIPKAKPLGT